MSESKVLDVELLERLRFKANQSYELVLYDRLSPEEQQALADLKKQPDFYGVLRPVPPSNLSIKSVSRDTALLYLTLGQPGPLPSYAHEMSGDNYAAVIARLVLDQILEVERNGKFVTGAQAYDLFYSQTAANEAPTRVAQLSIDALRYGQALAVSDIMTLSMRLYNFNRIPVSTAWRQRVPAPESVAELLGITPDGRFQDLRGGHWQPAAKPPVARQRPPRALDDNDHSRLAADSKVVGWLAWQAQQARVPTTENASTFKLYISPHPSFVRKAFDITTTALTKTQAFHFKVGADLEGLLRPDKMVAYFSDFDGLRAGADLLANKLDGCPPHGVPFTAEIAGDGLISWGVDPPNSQQLLSWQPQESWRLWLTNRLANALLAAKGADPANGTLGMEPWEYSLKRLRLEGVDTDSWTPAQQMWK